MLRILTLSLAILLPAHLAYAGGGGGAGSASVSFSAGGGSGGSVDLEKSDEILSRFMHDRFPLEPVDDLSFRERVSRAHYAASTNSVVMEQIVSLNPVAGTATDVHNIAVDTDRFLDDPSMRNASTLAMGATQSVLGGALNAKTGGLLGLASVAVAYTAAFTYHAFVE